MLSLIDSPLLAMLSLICLLRFFPLLLAIPLPRQLQHLLSFSSLIRISLTSLVKIPVLVRIKLCSISEADKAGFFAVVVSLSVERFHKRSSRHSLMHLYLVGGNAVVVGFDKGRRSVGSSWKVV